MYYIHIILYIYIFDHISLVSGWWLSHPSEKYDFVSGDDEIPNIWKHKSHVPNHQPAITGTKRFSMTISEIPMSFGSTGSYKVVPPVVGIAFSWCVNRTPISRWFLLVYRTNI